MTTNINFQIKDFDPSNGLFVINYFISNPDNGKTYSIPLPFNEDKTAYLSGQELIDFILQFAPADDLEGRDASSQCNPSEILSMMDKDVLSFEESKENVLGHLKEAFEDYSAQCHCMSSLGFEVDANDVAYRNIGGLIKQMENDGVEKKMFCDYNNVFHELTIDELKQIEQDIIVNSQNLYQLKWQMRNEIEAIDNQTDLDAYKFGIFEEFREFDIIWQKNQVQIINQ